MPKLERKMLERLGAAGKASNLPKGWSEYNKISDHTERFHIKQKIRQLHAEHCPSGTMRVGLRAPEPAREKYRASPPPAYSSARSHDYSSSYGW